MKVSKKFKVAIKLNDEPAYQIAQKAGIDPNLLSKFINGIVEIEPNDERVIKICFILLRIIAGFSSKNNIF